MSKTLWTYIKNVLKLWLEIFMLFDVAAGKVFYEQTNFWLGNKVPSVGLHGGGRIKLWWRYNKKALNSSPHISFHSAFILFS